jgi:alpha-beta hydrolase superfamily lysophospholipase
MNSFPSPIMSTLITEDKDQLAIYDWPLPIPQTARGTVLLVHGLGEHMGRYTHVAKHLNDWGFTVRGYDHYGHGLSTGPRGGLPSNDRMLDDLTKVLAKTRSNMRTNEPLVLIGHSMGGGVAGRYVSLHPTAVDALVMSSPALDAGLNIVQKLLLASLPFVAPNLRVANGLKSNFLSHDANTVSTYLTDPLVHDRISARLASVMATTGAATIEAATAWTLPTLLMFAGSDRLVSPVGSRAFSAAATSCVTTHEFKHMFHEIFNEPDQAQVFDTLKTWLDQVLPN